MAGLEEMKKAKVVKVESEDSWNLFLSQASNHGCPVIVHFSASWCVPSLAMNGYFEELALNYQDILFLLVDVDEVKEVAAKMEIKAMPTFVLMRDTEVLSKIVGANPDAIKNLVDSCVQSTTVPQSESV
ncbi:Thioredoxin [Rhynchospora pubera]|uniref:Thioredoxin n=1 Tax=Rhynchospora pubera TaxID=906938 RepID=A0AAV8FPQ1_9POAL|nr:Thioredoxin [Rhynchospora pubera]KAJ4792242.1 Thioredoxin [Rhynchospora pubera]